jgi:hypothetical protein
LPMLSCTEALWFLCLPGKHRFLILWDAAQACLPVNAYSDLSLVQPTGSSKAKNTQSWTYI